MNGVTWSAERIDRRAAIRRAAMVLAGVIVAPVVGSLAGCTVSSEPRAIAYGRDECAFCRMVVSEPRFAAALVSAKGRTFVFDSIECLAGFSLQQRGAGAEPARSLWVTDDARPGTLIPAQAARFLRLEGPSSPMGKGLVALSPAADSRDRGASASWAEVLALVEREGIRRGALTRGLPSVMEKGRAARG